MAPAVAAMRTLRMTATIAERDREQTAVVGFTHRREDLRARPFAGTPPSDQDQAVLKDIDSDGVPVADLTGQDRPGQLVTDLLLHESA